MSEQAAPAFRTWALVEIFGHERIAGEVSEQTIAGEGFIRVDVPAVEGMGAFTRLYGGKAIYSITPVSEAVARRAAAGMRTPAVNVYLLPPAPRGPLPADEESGDDGGEYGEDDTEDEDDAVGDRPDRLF